MYNEQGKLVAEHYHSLADRAALFARMEFYVNLLSLVFQAVVVTWLTRRGSVLLSLSAMPVVIGGSFVAMALYPSATMFLATQVLRRAADYGLGKPPREMLFTVLNPESKFKSKSLIDTVLQRGSDAVAQWLYLLIAGIALVRHRVDVRGAVRGAHGDHALARQGIRESAARRDAGRDTSTR